MLALVSFDITMPRSSLGLEKGAFNVIHCANHTLQQAAADESYFLF